MLIASCSSASLIRGGLTWARKPGSKWARTCAADRGRWAAAAMSQRSWAPAGVSGGTADLADGTADLAGGTADLAGCGDLAAVGGPPGACARGEVHAAARSATVTASAARNGRAGRPRLIFLRASSSHILSSSICQYPRRSPPRQSGRDVIGRGGRAVRIALAPRPRRTASRHQLDRQLLP